MALEVEEHLREDAPTPYKQWLDSLSAQAAAKDGDALFVLFVGKHKG